MQGILPVVYTKKPLSAAPQEAWLIAPRLNLRVLRLYNVIYPLSPLAYTMITHTPSW